MKKRLKQTVSMMMFCIMLVSLFPGGAWAEEGIPGSNGKNWFQEIVSKLEGNLGQQKTNRLPENSDYFDSTAIESEQTATVEESIQTTAVEGDYEYAVFGDNVTITRYKGTSRKVMIPGTLGGLPVTKIRYNAFANCISIMNITLPESLTSLGHGAFQGCSNLTSISLPESLTSIGHSAFKDCSSLTGISLPKSLTKIDYDTFSGCSSLTSISLPESLTSMGSYAFSGCSSLTSISLPENLTIISWSSFYNCSSLTTVSLPDSITDIYQAAFSGCSSLTSISLPESLTRIGHNAFSGCSSLTSISLPESLTSLGGAAFQGCDNLKSIQFNSAKTKIYDLGIVQTLAIPKKTTIIGYDPSTAKDYAKRWKNTFRLIDSSSGGGSSTTVSENYYAIAVKDYETKQPVAGVSVNLASKNSTTDSSGFATFENPASGDQTLVLKATGYCDYETLLKVTPGTAEVFYLRKDTDPGKPYVSMINLNDGSRSFDLFCQEKSYKERTSVADITDADKANITMKANWKGKTAKTYRLIQNVCTDIESPTETLDFESPTGTFDKIALGRKFKPGYKIYALVVAGDGTVSNAVETGIKISSAAFSFEDSDGSGELNLGKKMGATIPGDLPVLGGMEIDFGMDFIPASITVTPKSFRIAVGVSDLEDSPDNWTKFKKTISDAKDTDNRDKQLENFKKIFNPEAIGMPITDGWEPQADVVGYIEGTIVNGQPVVTKSTLILNAGASYSQQTQYIIGPVPVYLEVGGGLDVSLMGEIARIVPESGEMKLTTELTITPSFELGGGVGVANVVTVGASGKAELAFLTRFTNDYQKLSLTGSMSLKAKVLLFEYENEIAEVTKTIAEGYGNLGSVEANALENESVTFNIYDPNQYSLMPRDYAQNPTTWGGEQPLMSAQSTDYTNQTLSVLQTNLFPNAQPKMATIGDQQVMIWIADNTSRSSANRTMLVYSIYNPGTKTWSAPVAVADDSTADFYPQIASDSTSLYVTWQNSKTNFAVDVIPENMAKAGEIAVAKYNPASKTFDAATALTDNDTLDTQPQIAVSGDKAGVVWTTNSANDIFGTTGRNTIQYAALNGSAWTATQDLVSDQSAVTGLAAGYTGSTLSAVFTVDGDNDPNTITDRELFAAKPGQNATRLTNDNALDSNPVFASMNGSDSLFWYHDGNIAYTPAADLGATPATVFAETRPGFGDTFSIVNNPAGKTAVIWTQTRDEMTEIHGAIYENTKNQWSDDIQISNLGSRVQFPNGIFDDSGNFNIAFNRLTINADLTEQSDLCVVNVVPAYNLTLDNVSYSDDAVIPKTALPIEVEVTNNGQLPVDRITVDVTDGGTVNTITETIKPGETKTLNTTINLPETITKKDYTVSIKPATGDEYNISDNSKTITLGYTDLALAIEKNNVGDTVGMTVQVSNLSCVPTNAAIKVTEDTPDGKVLFTKDIANLTKGVNTMAIVELDPKAMTFAGAIKQIYVTVTASGEEISIGDNSDFIVVDNPIPTVDPGDPTAGGLVAFLGKDPGGTYFEYNAVDLNNAYLAYQINPGIATAKMYQQFLSSKCRVIGLRDKGKGYMDYNAAATASLMAQMKGEAFDINAYFASSDAGKLSETVENVKTVDKDGNIS